MAFKKWNRSKIEDAKTAKELQEQDDRPSEEEEPEEEPERD